VYNTNRDWEDSYRQRWQFDKIVRSTHGVNCTAPAAGKFTSKTGWSPGKPSRPTIPHPPGSAQPRTARLPARRQLLLVSLQRQPPEVPAGA
jgi:hypothetical protein